MYILYKEIIQTYCIAGGHLEASDPNNLDTIVGENKRNFHGVHPCVKQIHQFGLLDVFTLQLLEMSLEFLIALKFDLHLGDLGFQIRKLRERCNYAQI